MASFFVTALELLMELALFHKNFVAGPAPWSLPRREGRSCHTVFYGNCQVFCVLDGTHNVPLDWLSAWYFLAFFGVILAFPVARSAWKGRFLNDMEAAAKSRRGDSPATIPKHDHRPTLVRGPPENMAFDG
jgi:hypothetical protein